MKFVHISDLHIGKKLKEASLEEDQRYILEQIVGIVRDVAPDGVLIAGDVYDTTTPTTEAVTMLDSFLTSLVSLRVPVFVISGNHDSPEKLGFGSRLFETNRLYISGVFSGGLDVHTLEKDGESVDICMLPFIKPINARRAHPDDKIESYTDAVRSAIAHTELAEGRTRILVTHQFVLFGGEKPILCDSESVFVGGTEGVDSSVFDGFDYVALGHIHKPQNVGRDTIRYCGTPLKYSSSECNDEKSVTVVDIGEKVTISTIPLRPLRDIRILRGPLEGIIEAGKSDPHKQDFVYVELDNDAIDALPRLREIYPNVMSVEVTGRRKEYESFEKGSEDFDFEPVKAFEDFYERKTSSKLTDAQRRIVVEMFDTEAVQ